jgi:hypothetical protein
MEGIGLGPDTRCFVAYAAAVSPRVVLWAAGTLGSAVANEELRRTAAARGAGRGRPLRAAVGMPCAGGSHVP